MALLQTLEATPAWREGAKRVLDAHADELRRASSSVSPPRLRLRLAELLLAVGLADPALDLLSALPAEPPLADRVAFLGLRLAARRPSPPVKPGAPPTTPLGRMRRALVDAEIATYQLRRSAARSAALGAVLAEAADGSFASDELRFLAASELAPVLLTEGRAAEARALLDEATAIARRRDAPHDEAGLQTWRYLACEQLGDRPGMIAVGERARALPGGVRGALPAAMLAQLDAAVTLRSGDAAAGVRKLDDGIRAAIDAGDWPGFAALSLAKFKTCEAVGQEFPAFRALKVAGSLLRRNEQAELAGSLKAVEGRFRTRVGEDAWAALSERLIAEMSG